MISFIVCVISLFGHSKAFCQPDSVSDGFSFARKMIGRNLSSIKDSLRCMDVNCDTTDLKYNPPIRSFAYINPRRNLRTLGQTVFSMVLIFTDSAGVIDNIMLMTSYGKNVMPAHKEQFNKDYDELLNFLRVIFKSRGKKGDQYKSENYKRSEIKWIVDGFVFTLSKDEVRKNDRRGDFYTNTFTVFKDRKSVQ